jgi:hypothetical protein
MAWTHSSCSTAKIKALADVRPVTIDDADSIIRAFHLGHCQDDEVLPLASAKVAPPAPVVNPPAVVGSLHAAPAESVPPAPVES